MVRRVLMLVVLLVGVLSLLAGAVTSAQAALPDASSLTPGWNRLEPADAVCANGSPYAFFVRPGDPARLTFYFEGGGACWDHTTCGPFGPFDRSVSDIETEMGSAGIADFENPSNPVADDTIVLVSYCTADVHTGNRTVTFEGDPPRTMAFHGYDNASLILDWATANYPDAERVLVTGTSAGAYGALFNAPRIFDAYPSAQQFVLGDAGIGVLPEGWEGFDQWGTRDHVPAAVSEGDQQSGLASALATYTAAAYPDAQVAQYTTVADGTQAMFYALMGGKAADWTAGMRIELAALDGLENARVYVAPGTLHGILPRPEFYTMEADGVSFAEWFTGWLQNQPVPSVTCDTCS